jgi:adenosylmethionine-8-amino-7-oxononanoate aminotransferase
MTTLQDAPARVDAYADDAVEDYVARGLAHLWVHTQQYNDLAKPDGFKVFVKGDGIWLWDTKGRQFMDVMSGLWVVNAGHGRAEIADVAAAQIRELAYVNTFGYATVPAVDLATKLASLMPGTFNKAYFVNSGSEAVETAMRMAKHYQWNRGEKKRYKVISRRGSYHGMTAGALSVNQSAYVNRVPYEPLLPGIVPVENINCYRCPFEKTYPECGVFCARHIEASIQAEKPESIAAIIAEPISTANGNFVPYDEYWSILRNLCDKYGIVLIADEVINGFGRTGRWFAQEHFGVQADLMTMAKGLSSGYAPIAAVGVADHIAEAFVGEKGATFAGGITFGTHPVSCAVALANLQIIEREGLVENSERVGTHLAGRLRELQERHDVIGDVRGRGLLLAIEIVKDRETREPFVEGDGWADALNGALIDRGILTRAGGTINIAPPLVITSEEADDLVVRLDGALTQAEVAVGRR